MRIAEARDRTALFVRSVKEGAVSRGKELSSFVSCWRGSDPVALIEVAGGRDALVPVLHLAAVGFGADMLGLSNDTVMATELNHPDTGLPWEPGEITAYAAAHPKRAKEVTREMLMTLVVNRAGDYAYVVQAYETVPSPLVRGRTEIKWLDWEPPDGEVQLGGFLPDVMREVMEQPTVDVLLVRDGFPVGRDVNWRDHADLAVLRSAMRQFGDGAVRVLLFAEAGTDRQRLFQQRLGPGQVVEPPDFGGDARS